MCLIVGICPSLHCLTIQMHGGLAIICQMSIQVITDCLQFQWLKGVLSLARQNACEVGELGTQLETGLIAACVVSRILDVVSYLGEISAALTDRFWLHFEWLISLPPVPSSLVASLYFFYEFEKKVALWAVI